MRSEPMVILTRPHGENARLAGGLTAHGFTVREIPSVEVRPLVDPAPLREAVRALARDDVLVITSRAGAHAVRAALGDEMCAASVAAVGAATADACRAAGLRVTFTPSAPSGAALAAELPLPPGRILLARSDRAADEPAEILARRGAVVGAVVAYRTLPIAPREPVPAGAVIVFCSPSAVEGFALASAASGSAVAVGATAAVRVRALLGIEPRVSAPADEDVVDAVRGIVRESDAIAGR
jgi:uroporphyrinogen-III synthase